MSSGAAASHRWSSVKKGGRASSGSRRRLNIVKQSLVRIPLTPTRTHCNVMVFSSRTHVLRLLPAPQAQLESEVKLLASLRHPNVLPMFGVVRTPTRFMMVREAARALLFVERRERAVSHHHAFASCDCFSPLCCELLTRTGGKIQRTTAPPACCPSVRPLFSHR